MAKNSKNIRTRNVYLFGENIPKNFYIPVKVGTVLYIGKLLFLDFFDKKRSGIYVITSLNKDGNNINIHLILIRLKKISYTSHDSFCPEEKPQPIELESIKIK